MKFILLTGTISELKRNEYFSENQVTKSASESKTMKCKQCTISGSIKSADSESIKIKGTAERTTKNELLAPVDD